MSYAFLFKYIIIGDSGNSCLIQVWANLACCFNIPINAIEISIKLRSGLNSGPRLSMWVATVSNCKYGTQYILYDWLRRGKRALRRSPGGTTETQLELLSAMTYPIRRALIISQGGWSKPSPMGHPL